MGRLTPNLGRAAAGLATMLVLAAGGCGGGASRPPNQLVDGTAPPSLPVALRGAIAPTWVASRVKVARIRELDAFARRCVASFRPEFRIGEDAVAVRRTGAVGESLTFTDQDRDFVLGCDRTPARAVAVRRWCGRSVGRLFAGRLRDPRVDLACRAPDGGRIAFGWVETAPRTRWVSARAGPVTEIATTAAGLPVRVVTATVGKDASSATFMLGEYGASGKTLRSYRLTAAVAG